MATDRRTGTAGRGAERAAAGGGEQRAGACERAAAALLSALVSCPGRDAALFALLRRTGTVPSTGVRYAPASAAHRSPKSYALRCVRGTDQAILPPISG